MGKRDTPSPRTILFVGDLHCGGVYGLWPAKWIANGMRDITGASYLADCWSHHGRLIDELYPDGIDILVLTGDLIEGKNRKGQGAGLFTANIGEQTKGAIELLRKLAARSRCVIRVDGTGYHEEFDDALFYLDSELGVQAKQQVFDIQLPGGVLNVAHHPAGGSAIYQGTKLSKEAVLAAFASMQRQVPTARWIVRAHLHNYALQETQSTTVCLLPCWKLADFYAKKVNYWGFQPTIGSVVMEADSTHPGGYRFRPLLYEPLMPTVTNPTELLNATTKAKAAGTSRSGKRG